ncbi:PHD finger protein At1g33420 [Linum perenne]
MKGRSHRLQSHDQQPDDWVDGSWTVDCICGVNFDDGEEMVNCDECGVWVHTRCSRYVKGDDLFACDKCKAKNNRYNDNEETEVAQLLVELPTKTIRLESSCASAPPPRRPLRLWTDMPLEEKVHVQGIPGGDSALFRGLSSVFTPELWKCTGYVPKKFNFQYKEFPCWDKDSDANNEDENENNVDKGAGVLFSLSKESMFAAPREEKIDYQKSVLLKETKKRDLCSGELGGSHVGLKKKRSLLQPVLIHSGKRKKEDVLIFKDQSGKKKARVSDKEVDSKKRGQQTSRTAFPSTSSDAKISELHEGRDPQYPKDVGQDTKNLYVKEQGSQQCESGNHVALCNIDEDSKSDTLLIDHSMETPSILKDNLAMEAIPKERTSHRVSSSLAGSLKTDKVMPMECVEVVRNPVPVKQEEDDEMNSSLAGTEKTHLIEKVDRSKVEISDNDRRTAVIMGIRADRRVGVLKSPTVSGGTKDAVISSDNDSENIKNNDVASAVSPSRDKNAEEVERTSDAEAVSKLDKEKAVESKCYAEEVNQLSGDPSKLTRGEFGGSDNAVPVKKCNAEVKQDINSAGGQLTSSKVILSPPASSSQHKIMATVGKSSSNSSTNTVSKSDAPDHSASTDALEAIVDVRSPGASDFPDKKDQTANDIVSDRDTDRRSPSRSRSRDHSKNSLNSSSKLSSTSKILHTSTSSRRAASNSKDYTNHLSSKVSVAQKPCVAAGSLQNERGSNSQSRTGSGLPLRGEKINHSSSQSASKPSHSPSSNLAPPTTSISTLSDEELALLLHQELNSSPRVPRVPRVRQATQLASPTAASLLMKRSTSGPGAKDFSSFSRRKVKDVSKDVHSRAHRLDDEPRRAERRHSSPDRRRQDPESKRDEGGSSTPARNVKKSTAPVSNSTANSGRSSSTDGNDHHVSSRRKSPQNISDEETGPAGGSVRRTLPGLINEIMSKGKRMTYEELCNAVLPHWPSLRKHNGERYAYSSHSQAVLDCLRNRHEWARLVDRGPKTSSSRKRRKADAEESEDNEVGKGRNKREIEGKSLEAQREEFPKGKRKARKRRRLALQGRGINDARRKQPKGDQLTDDDSALFSNSSEESSFSDEDEMQGSAAGPSRSEEESDSSDETGTS